MSEVAVHGTQDSVHIFSRLESRQGELNMSLSLRDPNDDRELDVPPHRHNEPEPDEPEPDDETNDLVRPIKT
jgi:hypothetical protein